MSQSVRGHSRALLLAASLLAATLGCTASPGGGKRDTGAPAVRINGQEIPYQEFEAYLRASFGEELPPPEDAETRSRLLDQFVEERLLLQEAQARKMQVGDDKVEAYLAGLGTGTDGGKPIDGVFREQIRQNLLVQDFKDLVLIREVRVAPEEVEAYYREHPEEFREARVVILRQILVDEAGDAKKVLAALREDSGQFQVLAESHSISPDRGQPRPYEEQELPESMRPIVFSLSPGQVSDIVEDGGRYRIFQAVDRREGKNLTLEEVRGKIEILLLQRKTEEALAKALYDLRKSARIEVHVENLPFRYRGEYHE